MADHGATRACIQWLLVFLASAGFSAAIWLSVPGSFVPPQGPDYWKFYEPVAENLRAGRGLVTPSGAPAVRYPVGHPVFLAAMYQLAESTGVSRNALLMTVSVLLHALTATVLGWFASRFWSLKLALVPAILWTGYPLALWFIPLFGSETPFIPLFLIAVVCFWMSIYGPRLRYPGLVSSGALLGLAALFRPIILPVPFILVAILLWRRPNVLWRKRLVGAGLFFATTLAVVAPWEVWMYRHCDKFLLLSSGGLPSVIHGLTWAQPSDTRVSVDMSPDVKAFMTDLHRASRDKTISTFGQLSSWLVDRAVHQPWTVTKIIAEKTARSWYGTDSRRRETLLILIQIPSLALVLVGGVLAWRAGGLHRELVIFVAAIVLGTWMMTIVVLSIVRYMAPVMTLLFLLTTAILGGGGVHGQSVANNGSRSGRRHSGPQRGEDHCDDPQGG